MKIKLQSCLLGILLSFQLYASGFSPTMTTQDQPWYITASFGTSRYEYIYPKDKTTAVGRLAVENELLLAGNYALGLELGLQSGARLKLDIPKETITLLGWIPARTSLGPMLDLLVTAKSDPIGNTLFYTQFKGGVAYRYLQVNHNPYKDMTKLAGEIQAGLGYPISALASLNLLYQGVFGGDPKFQIDKSKKIEQVSNIPPLHAILLGLSFNI